MPHAPVAPLTSLPPHPNVQEGGHINKSLLGLGTVIQKLSEVPSKGAAVHVPCAGQNRLAPES